MLHSLQSNGFDSRNGHQGYYAERQMATVRQWTLKQLLIRVRKMSALGSIRVIILVYTGQCDAMRVVTVTAVI